MKIAMGLLWLTACLTAQTQVRLGMMLDSSGAVRPVHGVAASVTTGDATAIGVVSFSCGRERCLYKAADTLTDGRHSVAAPAGAAILGFDMVYFPESKQFACWRDGGLTPIVLDVTGDVLALGREGGALEIAVRRDSGVAVLRVRIDIGETELREQYPNATGPVLLLSDRVLLATADELILRHSDGSEQRFPLAGAQALFAASEDLVQIRTTDGNFALRVTPGRELLFQLPEPQP